MRFRCPNCQQQINVDDSVDPVTEITQEFVRCPSCDSRFSLFAGNDESTAGLGAGEKIGHFEVQQVLGEGAFGMVYKAWDPELRRHVAIKIPRDGKLNHDASRQFLREARAAASISHANVVGVHEVGQHEDSFYIACQYIEGITLREYLQTHPMTPRQTAALLIKLLHAIQFFHDKGIIHRDLKPGNILLDVNNEPYIADFGLARRENPDELTVTQSGQIVGTLLYMSPEQARGEIHSLSNRTDIYAMGVVLYVMLTGKRPFESTSSQTIIYHILRDDPKSPRQLVRQIPRDIETICLKALQKEPQNRYASAMAMAEDLQHFLDGRPITARPAGSLQKTMKFVRRNRLTTALVLVAAAAVAVAAFAVRRPPRGTVSVRIATEPAGTVRFVRYHENLRVPHASGFQVDGDSGQRLWLLPGLYKVFGSDPHERRHEVWRFVPESTQNDSTEQRFPHRAWTVSEAGDIQLQPFALFADAEVVDPRITLRGGEFTAGYEKNVKRLAGIHQQQVEDFQVSVNEISYGQYRRVMDQPIKSPRLKSTYLETFQNQYGDRSHIEDDQPVNGYPVDVAIVYCELAGGRLPTNVEWEYAATARGTADFPTGNKPAIDDVSSWSIMGVRDSTPDTTSEGIRNLFASVAEYTDSRTLSYSVLYPDAFPNSGTTDLSRMDFDRLPEIVEVRGAPAAWIVHQTPNEPLNVRARLTAPFPAVDSQALKTYERIGWRIFRSE